jgi:hypothetical protein
MVLCSSLLFTVSLAAYPPPVEPAAPCLASACVQADDDPADLLEDIMDEYQEANAELMQKFRSADKAEQKRLREVELPKLSETYAQRVLKLTSAHPGTDVAWEGLSWIVSRARGAACRTDALMQMFKDFGKDERIGDICLTVARGPFTADTVKALTKLAKKSPHKDVRGRATFALAMQFKGLDDQKGFIKQMSLVQKKYADVSYMQCRNCEGAGSVQQPDACGSASPGVECDNQATVAWTLAGYTHNYCKTCNAVLESRGDTADWKKARLNTTLAPCSPCGGTGSMKSLGAVAEGAMFEVERLQIGMVAPDIKGADLQGVDFKLSDYRGKVVVIDFWGNW